VRQVHRCFEIAKSAIVFAPHKQHFRRQDKLKVVRKFPGKIVKIVCKETLTRLAARLQKWLSPVAQ
jgi:hypothetical protein